MSIRDFNPVPHTFRTLFAIPFHCSCHHGGSRRDVAGNTQITDVRGGRCGQPLRICRLFSKTLSFSSYEVFHMFGFLHIIDALQVARVPRLLHRIGFSNNKNKSASGDGRQAQAGPSRPRQAQALSTPYLHLIYTLSTPYLHLIYTIF